MFAKPMSGTRPVLPGVGAKDALRQAARAADLPETLIEALPADGARPLPIYRGPVRAPGLLEAVPLDLALVTSGLRPAALLHGSEAWIGGIAAWAEARGLEAWPSAYAFRPSADPATGAYVNLAEGRHPATGSDADWRAIAVSPSRALAAFLWLSEAEGLDMAMGLALGYPACCVTAFQRDWPEAVSRHGGEMGRMRLSPDRPFTEIPARLNIFARYGGPVLTDHFPCSWSCEASLARADRLARGLARIDPGRLADIEARMGHDIEVSSRGWRKGRRRKGGMVRISVPELCEAS